MGNIKGLILKAIERRQKLLKVTDAIRLVNGSGDGLDGLLIDCYHHHVHIQILRGPWQKHMDELKDVLISSMPVDYMIVKIRRGLKVESLPLIGDNPETIVKEHGLHFKVHLNDGVNCGLFLDMRHNRFMVKEAARDKRVLNCFAYTCAFGVYAQAGGAKEVVNIDVNHSVLDRGKVNYMLNSLPVDDKAFVVADSAFFLKTALKKRNNFDVIILDPPSFSRHKKNIFQVKKDLPSLVAAAVGILNPGGRLLVSTNFSEMSYAHLERILAQHRATRKVKRVRRIGQDKDFCGSNSFKESFLVGLWIEFF